MSVPLPAGRRPPRSLYLHIPFCHRRCFYCDFPVVPLGDQADGSRSQSIADYLQVLLRDLAAAPAGPPLSTVYIGGGTPSMLSADQLAQLLAAVRRHWGLAPGAELSLEMDPASFDRQRLEAVLALGINRVSLGGQSFDDAVLERLGRRHRASQLREACSWLRQAQQQALLQSWSLDLIVNLPQQSLEAWDWELSQALAQEPPHLSIYDLIVEPGTVFAWRQGRGELPLPDDDQAADRLLMRRVHDRPHQTDGDGLEILRLQAGDDLARGGLIERRAHAALGIDALGYLIGVFLRDVGVGIFLGEIMRPMLAAFLQHQRVGEAFGGEEGGLGDLALDDGVGRARRAVDQHARIGQ